MSEEALEEVLRKASSDAQFRSRLQTDLEGAVRGFDLSAQEKQQLRSGDRKSTRLNSSHSQISYAVFCLKKNKAQHTINASPNAATTPNAVSIKHNYLTRQKIVVTFVEIENIKRLHDLTLCQNRSAQYRS